MTGKDKKEIHTMIWEAVDAVLHGIENMGYAKQESVNKLESKINVLDARIDTNRPMLKVTKVGKRFQN